MSGRAVSASDLTTAVLRAAHSPKVDRMRVVAEAYARLGLRVFPLHHPTRDGGCSCARLACRDVGKHPRTRNGVRDATANVSTIRAWWYSHPYANIGIATGGLVDVIDIDESASVQVIADLLAAQRLPAPAALASTGREGGGFHLYVAPTGAGNRACVVPGVDYRGRGGYVVAPPSRHESGRTYTWANFVLPLGSAEAGRLLPEMPWEIENRPSARVGTREQRFAEGRLDWLLKNITYPSVRSRHDRLLSAANSMGAMVAERWIPITDVEAALLGAYEEAGGDDQRGAARAIRDGLAHGSRKPLPVLGDSVSPGPVHDIVRDIREWTTSEAFRMHRLTASRRQVLFAMLDKAENLNRTDVRVSGREAQEWGAFASSASGRAALEGLLTLPVVERVSRRRGVGEAQTFRLITPRDWERSCDATTQDTVGVEGTTNERCSVESQLHSHPLWGHARGRQRGLTHTDRRLFEVIPAAADEPIRASDWARLAGCARETVCRSTGRGEDTLVGLGLVAPSGRGHVMLTPLGAALASAVQGLTSAQVLDDLAEAYGVATRTQDRLARIDADRVQHLHASTLHIVKRLLSGALASERVPEMVAASLGDKVLNALPRVCGALDLTRDPRAVRRDLADICEAAKDGHAWLPLTERMAANLRGWLEEGAATSETDVDGEMVTILLSIWRHRRDLGAPLYMGGPSRAELDMRLALERQVRTPRNCDTPAGYRPVNSAPVSIGFRDVRGAEAA